MSIDSSAGRALQGNDGKHSGERRQPGDPATGDSNGNFIRVIVADTQAISARACAKIFALEDDIRVIGQAETLSQTLAAAKKFSADI